MTTQKNKARRSPACRRLLPALALALALCLLAGCSAGQGGQAASAAAGFGTGDTGSAGIPEQAPAAPESSGSTGTVPAGPAGELKLILDPVGNSTMVTAGGRLYYLQDGSPALLYAQDLATGRAAPFCQLPGCSHDNPDCASWSGRFATDGNRMLYFNPDEDGCAAIYVANLDGGQRFKLCSFAPDEQICQEVVADDQSLYYLVTSEPVAHQPQRLALERFDLPSRTRTELCVLCGDVRGGTFFLDAACGDSLIFESYDQEGSTALSRYNLTDGSMTTLMEGSSEDCLLSAYEDWLFRFELGEDGEAVRLKAENWQDGRSLEMPGCFISVTGRGGVHPAGFYHDTLFVQTVDAVDAEGELVIRQYAVDCETQSLREATHLDPVTRRPQPITGGYTTPDGRQMLLIRIDEYSGADKETCTGSHYEQVPLEEYLS